MLNKLPWLLSLALAAMLAAWLASGSINGGSDNVESDNANATPALIKVRVKAMHTRSVDQNVTLYGRTEPNRLVRLKAEVDGRVEAILRQRGEAVKSGDPLLKIALNDRPQMLAHARAELAQRQLEYQGASALKSKGFQGKAEVARKKALLKEAQSRVAALQREIRNTVIEAPFSGVMLERDVEVGDYLSVGTPVATIVDLDPLVVRGDVTQKDIQHLHVGQLAITTLASGEQHQGKIRYLSSVADEETNTFRMEVALDNADGHLLGGLSVELQIPLEQIRAIKITPALMALNEAGIIGIKWVKDGTVQFTPIDVVRSDPDGTWIKGLPDEAQVITVGQAFVRKGDKVETRTDAPGNS